MSFASEIAEPSATFSLQVVELGLAVAVGPPQPRVLHQQLRELSCGELDDGLARLQSDGLVDGDGLDGCVDDGLHRRARLVRHWHRDIELGGCGVVIGEGRDHLRVAQLEPVRRAQRNRLPDARVAVADGGDPVPALGGDEGGAVEYHRAAVLARPAQDGLLLRDAGVGRRRDAHGEHVTPRLEQGGRVELAALECARHIAHAHSVQPHRSAVVDALKVERQLLPSRATPAGRTRCGTSSPVC